ncbi:hypothetical protein FQN57_001635 [Myotisia sp. PD_48]|nr:hypothetical protein FQN57_001635 [Myotisia sp. PD_48]
MATEPDANTTIPPNTSSLPPTNPPSVEAAYKRKCIALKKRLNEVEAHNDSLRIRNSQGIRYIQKMRLESCILLERLAVLMRMEDEPTGTSELDSRGRKIMDGSGSKMKDRDGRSKRNLVEQDFLEDESEGSSGQHPPTPQERPHRIKRNRRSEEKPPIHDPTDTIDFVSTTLPSLPFITPRPPPRPPGFHQNGPLIRLSPYTLIAPNSILPTSVDFSRSPATRSPADYRSQEPRRNSNSNNNNNLSNKRSSNHKNNPPNNININNISSAPQSGPGRDHTHRYVSAFEDFTNRNRSSISQALIQTYGNRVSDEDIDRALVKEWDALEPAKKREFGDRLEKDGGI